MTSSFKPKFIVLAILDGWGIAPESPGNAISEAQIINIKKFSASYPHCELEASGLSVGLPKYEDGNTETGHINIGAGRIVYQDLERINMSISDGTFFKNQILLNAIYHVKKYKSNLHYMGLIGAGGVHSNIEHLIALIKFASKEKVKKLYLHLFTDGRDSPPTAAKSYLKRIKEVIEREKIGIISSIMGRYWSMDRDQRWERTEKAYFALTKGIGNLVNSPEEAIDNSYSEGKTDEFIEPSLIVGDNKKPIALISKNDSVIFFNFRIDRPRQLSKAFILKDFSKAQINYDYDPYLIKYSKSHLPKDVKVNTIPFNRGIYIENLLFITMTEYSKQLIDNGAKVAFSPEIVQMPLSALISLAELRQLKITESEKERFVTFYFNGLREKPYSMEDRIIIPSPKIPTYDQKPEMSSFELTQTLLNKLSTMEYKFILVNYPNPDIVGHTGNIGATVKAIETVDDCIGKLANFINAYDGALIITSDHGNAEELINLKSGEIDTEHSNNRVPFIYISRQFLGNPQKLRSGILADIAPTILSLLNLQIPSSMTGRNLLSELNI